MSEPREEYRIDGLSPEEYFKGLERPQVKREELSSEEYRRRLQGALQRHGERTKGRDPKIVSYIASLPEDLRDLAEAFCDGFRRAPISRERSFWIKSFREQIEMGLDADMIRKAIAKMDNDGLTIKSPASVTAVADDIRRRESKQTKIMKNIIRVRGDNHEAEERGDS